MAADLPGKYEHAQNYINNGNLPGKSAATYHSKLPIAFSSEILSSHFRVEQSEGAMY